jgi:hypothetical protein
MSMPPSPSVATDSLLSSPFLPPTSTLPLPVPEHPNASVESLADLLSVPPAEFGPIPVFDDESDVETPDIPGQKWRLPFKTNARPPAILPTRCNLPTELGPTSSAPFIRLRSTGSDIEAPEVEVSGKKRKRKRTDKDKQANKDRRRRKRESVPPTAKLPSYKDILEKLQNIPAFMPTSLAPLDHFPVVSTGYTGDLVEPIRRGGLWNVDELLEMGFEVFEWDGRSVACFSEIS